MELDNRDDFGDAVIITILHNEDRSVKSKLESLGVSIPIYYLRDIIDRLDSEES